MRINQPSTDEQYDFPATEQLVSVTDLQGRIRYCNAAFVEISGFSREDLIGQPHNIVRHPDMPPAAFSDLWRTVKTGRSWTALVKNRRRDGAYYWVRANVTPIVEHGKTVGYLSVRVKPDAAEVSAVKAPYAALLKNQQGACRYAMRHGKLHRTGPVGLLQRLTHASVPKRVAVALAVPLLCSFIYTLIYAWQVAQPAQALATSTPATLATLNAALTPTSLWGFAATLLLTSLASGAWLINSLQKSMLDIGKLANRLAACDLSAPPAEALSDGPLSQVSRGLTQLRANLSAVVCDVHRQADGVRSAVREIAIGNADLAARTERQAAYLERTTDTVRTLRQTSEAAQKHVNDTAETSAQAADAARNGEQVIGRVRESMATVARSSQRIQDITSLIDGIAFQTNLLALNAAVEAARAGEHGRSFSVVAGEVQLLAGRCASAAKEIDGLIKTSVQQVEQGSVLARQAGETMTTIVQSFEKTVDAVHALQETERRQAASIDMVEQAINELDVVTQQNAALVEEVSASAQNQRDQADMLTGAVEIFSYRGKPRAADLQPRAPVPQTAWAAS